MDIVKTLAQDNMIVVFDIDGVLAPYEFGEGGRHKCDDHDWELFVKSNHPYRTIHPIRTIQDFIQSKGTDNIYVCSVAETFEQIDKIYFASKHYLIPKEHIFFVHNAVEKIDILKLISEKRKVPQNNIAIVEDTVSTLDQIYDNSDFITVHVSSFYN